MHRSKTGAKLIEASRLHKYRMLEYNPLTKETTLRLHRAGGEPPQVFGWQNDAGEAIDLTTDVVRIYISGGPTIQFTTDLAPDLLFEITDAEISQCQHGAQFVVMNDTQRLRMVSGKVVLHGAPK